MKRMQVVVVETVSKTIDILVPVDMEEAEINDEALEQLCNAGPDSESVEDRQIYMTSELPPKQAVTAKELNNLRMAAGNESKYDRVVLDGKVMSWVGIGWIEEREALPDDYDNYPVVVEDSQ